MGSDDVGETVERPALSFSKCRPKTAKRKHRTNSSKAANNRHSSVEPGRNKKLRKSMPPIPSFRASKIRKDKDDALEELERSFFADSPPPKEDTKSKATTKAVGSGPSRPPIPSFTWNSDTDDIEDDLLAPVFSSKKKTKKRETPEPIITKHAADNSLDDNDDHGVLPFEEAVESKETSQRGNLDHKSSDIIDTDTTVPESLANETPTSEVYEVKTAKATTNSADNGNSGTQPCEEELTEAIDKVFQGSDLQSFTLKQFTLTLEKQFKIKFPSTTKAFIKDRLSNLINGIAVVNSTTHKDSQICSRTTPLEQIHAGTQPCEEELTEAIDKVFRGSDLQSITLKQFTLTLEKQFQIKFTSTIKAFIKNQLSNLINGRVMGKPTIGKDSQISTNTVPLRHSAKENVEPNQTRNNQQQEDTLSGKESSVNCTANLKSSEALGVNAVVDMTEVEDNTDLNVFPEKDQPEEKRKNDNNPDRNDLLLHRQKQGRSTTAKSNSEVANVALESTCCDSDDSVVQIVEKPKRPRKKGPLGLRDDTFEFTEKEATKTKRSVSKRAPKPKVVETKCVDCDPTINDKESTSLKKAPAKKAAPQKATRKRGRASACSLCKTCPCKTATAAEKRLSTSSLDLNTLNQSDAAVEKTLIRRLQKLEKTTEKYEEQADIARRELKKHRRNIWRKREEKMKSTENIKSDEYRFLPDGEELDEQLDCFENPILAPKEDVTQARIKLFGTNQPTLTQLFSGSGAAVTVEQQVEEAGVASEGTDGKSGAKDAELDQNSNSHSCERMDVSDEDASMSDDNSVDAAFHRVTWTKGTKSSEPDSLSSRRKTAWGALLSAAAGNNTDDNYDCAFNRLFAAEPGDGPEKDGGIDDLLGLFDDISPTQSPATKTASTATPQAKCNPVDFSMLTQRGKDLAEDIQGEIICDTSKLNALESACPQWRENVAFAMNQQDEGDIETALDNVERSKERLAMMKESFLRAWQQQQTVLDVFELSLNKSRKRLRPSSDAKDVLPVDEHSSKQC